MKTLFLAFMLFASGAEVSNIIISALIILGAIIERTFKLLPALGLSEKAITIIQIIGLIIAAVLPVLNSQ